MAMILAVCPRRLGTSKTLTVGIDKSGSSICISSMVSSCRDELCDQRGRTTHL